MVAGRAVEAAYRESIRLEEDAGAEREAESARQLHRSVWALAWPSVLTMMLQTVNSFLDRFFVGSLGSDALAAAGVGGQVMFVLVSLGMSLGIGTTALVARFTGAGDTEEATVVTNQSVWIAGALALISMGLMMPARRAIVLGLGVDPHAADLCVRYLTVTIAGVPALYLMLILSGVYRGMADTVTPLLVMVGVNIVHLGGDYLLIFGRCGLPKMGLTGGAVALVTSQVIGAVLYFLFLRRSPVRGWLHCRKRLEWEWAKRILRIGFPAALQNQSRVLSMLAFTGVLARTPEGTAAVAAMTIGLTSESIAFMPGIGFATAASALTGQNLGAGNPGRAERAGWSAFQQGFIIMVLMAAVFYTGAAGFCHIFTHDPKVVPLGVAYLKTMAISEPFLAIGMILGGALNGAGDTRATAWVSIVTMWCVRLPLALWLTRYTPLGTVGAWWAMAASTILGGVIVLAIFKAGRWKRTRV